MNNIEIRSKISNEVRRTVQLTQVGRRQNLKGIRVQQIVDTGSRHIDFILIHIRYTKLIWFVVQNTK